MKIFSLRMLTGRTQTEWNSLTRPAWLNAWKNRQLEVGIIYFLIDPESHLKKIIKATLKHKSIKMQKVAVIN